MKRTGTTSFLVIMAVVVLGLVFLSTGPAAWAQAVTTTVTPTAAATVATADGNTEVRIPAGAVTESVDVTLTPKTVADAPAAAPAGTEIVGVFTIEVAKAGVAQASFTFSQAITICTKVTQADLDKVNNDVTKVRIMRYAVDTSAWVPLTTTVDPPIAGSPACATTRSVSAFALAVTGQPTPTPKLEPGDTYLSGSSNWWVGLAVLGLFLVVFGGVAIRRQANKRNM